MSTGLKSAVRGFATAKEGITKLSNGLSVLSVSDSRGSGLLRVSVLGGSRYEKYDNLGVSHALRSGVGLSAGSHSFFGVTRGMQQSGAFFNATQGREILSYSLMASPKQITSMSDLFVDSVSNPAFKHWEVSDECPTRMKNDIGCQSPASMAQELLYKAAFRNGLGNSIYSPSFMIGSHNAAMLKTFFDKAFAADRATLIGFGVSHDDLLKIAEKITLPSNSSLKPPATTFYNQECRSEHNGLHAHVALGFAGPGFTSSEKDRISALLYQRILGVGSRVKRGLGLGRLSKLGGEHLSASCIAQFHQDAGLFGAYLAISDFNLAGESVRKVIQTFKNAQVSEAEVKAAKRNLIADLSEVYMSPSAYCDVVEEQILLGGGQFAPNFKTAEASINSVTIGDVQALAKKVSSSPMAMGAIGNLMNLPYLDEL